MAAPANGVLDNFNRTASASLGSNWAEGDLWAGGDNFQVVDVSGDGRCRNTAGSQTIASARWTASTFGPDQEAFCTVITTPQQSGDRYSMACHIKSVGSGTTDAYGLSLRNSSGSMEFRVQEIENETETDVGAAVGITFNAGDKMWLEVIGTTCKGYRFNGTSWSEEISRTPTLDLSADTGQLGLYHWEDFGEGPELDDFGGGTISSGQTITLTGAVQAASAIQSPSMAGSGAASISPSPVGAASAIQSPSMSGSGSAPITPNPVAATSAIRTPSMAGSGAAPISPSPVGAASAIQAPTIANVGADQTIEPGAVAAAASIVAPKIQNIVVGPSVTDALEARILALEERKHVKL